MKKTEQFCVPLLTRGTGRGGKDEKNTLSSQHMCSGSAVGGDANQGKSKMGEMRTNTWRNEADDASGGESGSEGRRGELSNFRVSDYEYGPGWAVEDEVCGGYVTLGIYLN